MKCRALMFLPVLVLAVVFAACNDDSPTSPLNPTPGPTPNPTNSVALSNLNPAPGEPVQAYKSLKFAAEVSYELQTHEVATLELAVYAVFAHGGDRRLKTATIQVPRGHGTERLEASVDIPFDALYIYLEASLLKNGQPLDAVKSDLFTVTPGKPWIPRVGAWEGRGATDDGVACDFTLTVNEHGGFRFDLYLANGRHWVGTGWDPRWSEHQLQDGDRDRGYYLVVTFETDFKARFQATNKEKAADPIHNAHGDVYRR